MLVERPFVHQFRFSSHRRSQCGRPWIPFGIQEDAVYPAKLFIALSAVQVDSDTRSWDPNFHPQDQQSNQHRLTSSLEVPSTPSQFQCLDLLSIPHPLLQRTLAPLKVLCPALNSSERCSLTIQTAPTSFVVGITPSTMTLASLMYENAVIYPITFAAKLK
jgi:hypothetical protein